MRNRKKLSPLCLFLIFMFTLCCFFAYPTSALLAAGSGTITVTSPGTGNNWAIGSQQTIQWDYSGVSDSKVTITLFKAGKSKLHIASSTAIGSNGSGSYTWTIPSTLAEGSDYQIKVLSSHCPDGGWSGYFTIGSGGSTANSSISVSSPASGNVFSPGSTHTIRWNYTGSPGSSVNISLYKAGALRSVIKSGVGVGTGGSGTYDWTLPTGLPEGNDYQVKVLSASSPDVFGLSGYFSVGAGATTQQTTLSETVLINDASFVTLTAVKNSGNLYDLQVKANNAASPVEVSYLVLNPSATPDNPSQGIAVSDLTESESTWGGSQQFFGHTEVGGWAMTQYQQNPKSFALPHYRTCVMMLARYEKIYVVFLRENDGQLTYQVFQGGAFNGLEVPGLGTIARSGDQFQVHSNGGAVEVGIWDKGTYKHDEVTGWAQASYQANDKLYPIPKYGMFMMTIGRYGKLGLVIGNLNDGRLGTVCFSGSKLLGTETVPGLCEITSAGDYHIRVRATGSSPVEVSQFAFNNTCWQWEVNGWGKEDYKANPQVLPLKHYIPGFITCSRYDKEGIFFYNENDGQLGILPLTSSTQVTGSSATRTQQTQNTGQNGEIRVFLNGQQLSFDDQPPVIIGGSTIVPMRAIFEALGAKINWNPASQMVTATRGDTTIKLIIGMQTSQVNGHETALSQPAQILGGRTMVPLRFVAEALNAEVNWDGDTRTITITLNDTIAPPTTGGGTEQPTGAKSVIEQFFSLVDSGDVNSALTLLDAEALGDASSQEMWKTSLGSIDTATITSIEESNKAEWPDGFEQYKVTLNLHLKPGSQSLWSEGSETRWVSLVKADGQWKILELATGQ